MRSLSSSPARGLLLVAIALTGLLVSRSDVASTTFNPVVQPSLQANVAGANSGLTVHLEILEPDANFSAVITFVPTGTGLGACAPDNPAGVTRACADEAVPNGAIMGKIVADSTLGLVNNPCNNVIAGITFNMMDATTDMSQTVTFEDDPADGPDPGETRDRGEQFEDDDGDGVPNGAEMYPEYLTRLIYGPSVFGVPGSAPLQPIQRTWGQTIVAGVDVSLTLLVMEPGITINGLPLDAADGYPVITVLQNTGDPGAMPVPPTITDFCAPLLTDAETYGVTRDNPDTAANEHGFVYATNPMPGNYPVSALLFSQRDDDDDNIENQLDTCPNEGNSPGFDPRMDNSPGDADQDGIPDICDAAPNDGNTDADGDGFLNRGDNCPQMANPLQTDLDRDGIGAGCDSDDLAPGPHIHVFPATFPETTIGQVTMIPARNGDSNCDGEVTSVDALQSLRFVVDLPPQAPCINVAGDANCDGTRNSVDALAMLRHVADLPVTQQPGCTPLGEEIT